MILLHVFSLISEFRKEHNGIFIGFILSLFVVFSYLFSLNEPEWWLGAEKWFNAVFQIAIGYLINFLFYITQLYLPKIEEEKKAQLLIQDDLNLVFVSFCVLHDKIKAFAIIKNDTIDFKSEIIYITNDSEKNTNYDYIDIKNEFAQHKKSIQEYVNKIINNKSFNLCSTETISLISRIQACKFLESLSEIIRHANGALYRNYSYYQLSDRYKEFNILYEEISKYKYNENFKVNEYRELTDNEREKYLELKKQKYAETCDVMGKEIVETAARNGEKIYIGCIRII